MSEQMGYNNALKVYELASQGKLAKPRGGKLTINTMAMQALTFMALNTYDFPPSQEVKKSGRPCRYYTLGWRAIAETHGMMILSNEQTQDITADLTQLMQQRANTAQNRISKAWKFLQEQKLIKVLVPASLGKNAGFLLLIGDNEENYECEKYARERLGLPYPTVEEL